MPPAAGRSVAIPPLVTWTLVTAGVWLIYASVKGLSPLAELKAALTGSASPGPKPLSPLLVSLGATIDDGTTAPLYSSRAGSVAASETALSNMVSADGSPLLSSKGLTGFLAWQKAYGAPIKGTGWRSLEDQAKGYASDPDRFAPPEKSWHPKGLAVDVDLAAMNANPGTANWDRLYAAAMATGWCNPRGPYKGDHKENWHFSYGGCG